MKRSSLTRPRKGFWTCQRQHNGVKCGSLNPNRKQKCMVCGGAKPAKSKPKHMQVLTTMTYEDFVEITGSETCGICGAAPKAKRLHRDHDHRTGRPRGLLCFRCNSGLRDYMTLAWMRAAVAYLERSEDAA